MPQWYIGNNPKLWSPAQLKAFAAQGKITPETMVRREDSTEAVPAGRLRGLFLDPEPVSFMDDEPLPEVPSASPEPPVTGYSPEATPEALAAQRNDAWHNLEQAGIAGYFKAILHPQIYSHLPGAMVTAVVVVVICAIALFLLSSMLMNALASLGLPLTMLIATVVMALLLGIMVLRVPLAIACAVVDRRIRAEPGQLPLAQTAILGAIILAMTWLLPATVLGFIHPIAGTIAALLGFCALPLFLLSIARAEGDWSGLNPSSLMPMLGKRWATFLGFIGVTVLLVLVTALLLALVGFALMYLFANPQTNQVEGWMGLALVCCFMLGILAWFIMILNYMATAAGIWWRQGLSVMAAEMDAMEQGRQYRPASGEGLFAGLGIAMIVLMIILALTETVSLSGAQFTSTQHNQPALQHQHLLHHQPQHMTLVAMVEGNLNDTAQTRAIDRSRITPQEHRQTIEIEDQAYIRLHIQYPSPALCQIKITSRDALPIDVYVFNESYFQRWAQEFPYDGLDLGQYDILEKHEGITQARIDELAAGTHPLYVVIDNSEEGPTHVQAPVTVDIEVIEWVSP